MIFDIFTIFPHMFGGFLSFGIVRIAKEKGLATIRVWDIRSFTSDKHKRVDDYPYGGGPGMVLKPEPIFNGVRAVQTSDSKVILLSPQGELYTQEMAQKLANEKHLIFICGRYQGVDQRVIDALVDLEISIGNYVLSGGEVPCMVIIDSIVRLLPGVVKNRESLLSDSFGEFDAPLYTRPREFENMRVPDVLLSGNHKEIEKWRMMQRKKNKV